MVRHDNGQETPRCSARLKASEQQTPQAITDRDVNTPAVEVEAQKMGSTGKKTVRKLTLKLPSMQEIQETKSQRSKPLLTIKAGSVEAPSQKKSNSEEDQMPIGKLILRLPSRKNRATGTNQGLRSKLPSVVAAGKAITPGENMLESDSKRVQRELARKQHLEQIEACQLIDHTVYHVRRRPCKIIVSLERKTSDSGGYDPSSWHAHTRKNQDHSRRERERRERGENKNQSEQWEALWTSNNRKRWSDGTPKMDVTFRKIVPSVGEVAPPVNEGTSEADDDDHLLAAQQLLTLQREPVEHMDDTRAARILTGLRYRRMSIAPPGGPKY